MRLTRGFYGTRKQETPTSLVRPGHASKPLTIAAVVALMTVWPLVSEAEAQVLGTAESFAVLGGQTVTNTGSSVITGNVGVSPGSAVTGFPPGIVIGGTIHAADAVAAQAQADLTTAYNSLQALPFDVDLSGQDLGGLFLMPGVYNFDTSAQLTGVLTLDGAGNSASRFVFQIGSTLTTASNSAVLLINGANANNVFWVVGSSATLGTNSVFAGNILALTSITLNTGASIICGRALAQNGSVTLDSNTITLCTAGGDGDNGDTDIDIDTLFGEGISGFQETAFGASRLFGSAMLAQAAFMGQGAGPSGPQQPGQPEKYQPLKLGPSDVEPAPFFSDGNYQPRMWRAWAAGLGRGASLEGDSGAANLDMETGGLAAGIDYRLNRTTLVGVAGGYTSSDLSVDELQTEGSIDGAHVGLYGVKWVRSVYLAGFAEYGRFSNHTDRRIDWIIDERAQGKFSSDEYGGRVEAGWRQYYRNTAVTPFVGFDAARLDSNGFTETSVASDGGPGILGLTFDSHSVDSLVSSLGIQFDSWIALRNDRVLRPFVRVAWRHEFETERTADSFLTAAPGAAFTVAGASAAEDSARVDAGVHLDVTERVGLFAIFEGEFSDRGQSYAGLGGIDGEFNGAGQGQAYGGRVGMKVAW